MDIPSILLIALGLSADCFAVSLGAGAIEEKNSKLKVLRVTATFGLFQFLMPLSGWFVGSFFVDLISSFDHWIAFCLLLIVGGRMIWEFFREEKEKEGADISRGFLLIVMAIATSIDALAVGLSFAFLEMKIIMACLIIGIVAFAINIMGFWLGNRVQAVLGKRAKLIGGIILIGIGLRILIEHLPE
jgi:putative Mn2+ efflux pump MntP